MNTSQHREPKYDLTKKRTSLTNMCRLVFGTEIWSLLFVFVVQELPFTVLRLVVMVHYQHLSKNYTLYFFVIKNLVLSACELYYIGVILVHHVKKYQKEKKQQEIIAWTVRLIFVRVYVYKVVNKKLNFFKMINFLYNMISKLKIIND